MAPRIGPDLEQLQAAAASIERGCGQGQLVVSTPMTWTNCSAKMAMVTSSKGDQSAGLGLHLAAIL
jgi:hypothetical protein